jgi:hypothetical protein
MVVVEGERQHTSQSARVNVTNHDDDVRARRRTQVQESNRKVSPYSVPPTPPHTHTTHKHGGGGGREQHRAVQTRAQERSRGIPASKVPSVPC